MPLTGWDHYTLRCADLQTSWRFYEDVLGLRIVERPGMPVPAAIAYLGDMMLIHMFQATPEQDAQFAALAAPAEAKQWGTGRIHHIAFMARGLGDVKAGLEAAGIAYTERTLQAASKHLVMLKDPDHVEIELAFGLDELESK